MRYLIPILCISIFWMGCSETPSVPKTKTAHGVPYEMLVNVDGPTAKTGDYVEVNIKYTSANDSTFFNTFKKKPSLIEVQKVDGYGDQDEWFQMMSEGDSAKFYVIADSLFRVTAPPRFIKQGEYICATVKMNHIMDETAYVAARQAQEKQKIEGELQVIRAWLDERGIAYQESPEGVIYTIERPGTGEKPVAGDKVKVDYTGKLLDGQEFDSSVKRGPYQFVLGQGSVIPGWDKGLPLFHEGAKATLYLAPSLGYGKQGSDMIPPNSPLIFDIELVDVSDPLAQTKSEIPQLEQYIKAQGWESEVQHTDEYLYYVIHEPGSGPQPRLGQQVSVHYTGKLFNGTVFDSSVDRGEPITFPLGQRRVIKGWDIGIGLLHEGAKATFIIPSPLAYGERGSPPRIPTNSPLVFDVELVKVQ